MSRILISNVMIFEGTEKDLRPGEVLVQGNRIQAVAGPGESLPREGAEILDAGGATLMPGMVNTHCHLTYNNGTTVAELTALPVEEHVLLTMHNARLALDMGFTAAIGAASAKPRLDIVIRNEINAGKIPGPRLLAGSPELTVTGGLADDNKYDQKHPSISIICDTPDEFRKVVRTMIREGVDLIKFNNSGDSFCFPRMAAYDNPMTDAEVAAICDTANNIGKRLAAHAHADSSVRQCMKYGVEFIFHATFATDETIEQLEKVKDRHYVSPAIAARYNTTYEAKDWGITTDVAEIIGNKRELEEGIKVMRKMRAAGIKVLPFGDYGFAWLPHGTEARDLEHFVNLFGYEPWEVLRAATAWGGEAWAGKSGEKMGRVQPGYLADILLVDGNPLYDLSLLQDRHSLLAIMKDGLFHKPFQGRATDMRVAAE
ncbi:metal-dependent hydrolase family protein [Arenibaculum pallidiluteum]|uniref:metal-dependent hydrolase family protein n=1 Tax=Arenibaculum pallidiluteum TaxID=2812559 RepID=UPI001A9584C6|nr:amidohydrolase family protein [Arenibaculum pallidiluteum]